MYKINPIIRGIAVICLTILTFSCATSKNTLKLAEKSWAAGDYDRAIEVALDAWTEALEKNKSSNKAKKAQIFLVEKFPVFNTLMSQAALNQLNGTIPEQLGAWKLYASLVNINRRIADSSAYGFLESQNYEDELVQSRNFAAQLLYDKAIAYMEEETRTAYIEAIRYFDSINEILTDFLDSEILRSECVNRASITIALSDNTINLVNPIESNFNTESINDSLYSYLKKYIISHYLVDIINFLPVTDMGNAIDAGAEYFIENEGIIKTSPLMFAESQMAVTSRALWVIGNSRLTITRLSDSDQVSATAEIMYTQDDRHEELFQNDENWSEQYQNFHNFGVINDGDRTLGPHPRIATHNLQSMGFSLDFNFKDTDLAEEINEIIVKQYLSDKEIQNRLVNL